MSDYNKKGHITAETFRVEASYDSLKKFYHDRSIKLEDLDYNKLYEYPKETASRRF